MRAAFHSAESWLSFVMIVKSGQQRGGRMNFQGRAGMQRIGPGAPPHKSAWKIRQHGRVFPRSTSKGGHGLPSSRFERVSAGAVRVRLLRFLYMHGKNQSKNRKYSEVSY